MVNQFELKIEFSYKFCERVSVFQSDSHTILYFEL